MLISCCDHISLPFFLLRVWEKKNIYYYFHNHYTYVVCFLIFHPNTTLTTKDNQRYVCIMQFVKWQYMKIVLQGQCQNCKSVSFWTQNLSSLAPTCNKYKVTILGWFSLFVRISVSIREEKKERRCVGLPIPAAFSSPKGHHPTHNNNNIHLALTTILSNILLPFQLNKV